MNIVEDRIEKWEYYRGNELPAGNIEESGSMQNTDVPLTRSNMEGRKGEDESQAIEREKQLELWMEDVKAFIRGIDVSNL